MKTNNQSSVLPASHYVLLIARWCVESWNRQQHQANELRRRSYWSFQGWRMWNTTNCTGKPENKQKKQNYTLHKTMFFTGKMEFHFQNILTTITYSFCDDMSYSIQWSHIHFGGYRCVGENHLMDTAYSKNIVMWMWTFGNPSALKYVFQHQALPNAATFLADWVNACVYLHTFKCFNIWQISVPYTWLLATISEKSHYFSLCCYHKNEMNIICTINRSIKNIYMYNYINNI